MSLSGALSIANSGLYNISEGFGIISQNIANAQTPGYATETTTTDSLVAGDQPEGVGGGQAVLATDSVLQQSVFDAGTDSSQWAALSNGLSPISPALGAVGGNDDLGSLLDGVQSAFAALLNDPSSAAGQQGVVAAASTLTTSINQLAASYNTARQSAQNSLVTDVASLNSALSNLGNLNSQIVALKAQGQSIAGLQNQQSALMQSISNLIPAQFVTAPTGAISVLAGNGVQLPTDGTVQLSIASATTGPNAYYPGGGLPGIMLGSTDITANLNGGQIGALVNLRDQIIPQFSAELDQFSQGLAGRFAAQGLNLFTDGLGNVPVSAGIPVQTGYIGFSSEIQVNPAIIATPSLVRDGTEAIAGSPAGASAYTPNPQNLPGFNGMILRVLNFALTNIVQTGVTQPAIVTAGLGPGGNLSANFSGASDLGDFATALTVAQSSIIGQAGAATTDAQAVQTSLSTSLTAATGVSVDSQLSQLVALQNAYGANAKVISTVQEMMGVVISMVQT